MNIETNTVFYKSIFDTNTIVSAVIFRNSVPAKALRKAALESKIYFSKETKEELFNVINRKKFDKYYALDLRLQFVESFLSIAHEVEAPPLITPTCRDPKDDKFLALALAIDAQFIITGDDDLLVLNPFHGTTILNANDYLELNSQNKHSNK